MSRIPKPKPDSSAVPFRRLATGAGILFAFRIFTLAAGVLPVSPAEAQDRGGAHAPAGQTSISGRVIDAETGLPLRTAQVSISAGRAALLDGKSDENGAPELRYRIVLTDVHGEYTFAELHPGTYRVYVQTPGYRGTSVDVDLSSGGAVRVTLGLELAPVTLPAIAVTSGPPQPFASGAGDANRQAARRAVVVGRQAEFLETDVRSITVGDVQDAVTLAEPDIFRAIQRMAGVNRRDDYTAVLWTRGAPWVQTRVYFDGMPLYNPTHGGWLFSAVNPDGVGSAVFQPGVRSASWGEGAAGIVDLRSRDGGDEGPIQLRGELSLASAKLSGDGRLPGGITWLLAGRRTYVDLITGMWEWAGGNEDTKIPYDFSDYIGRVTVPLPFGVRVEASSLMERDRLRGNVPRVLDGNRAKWGNRVNQVTARVPLAGSAVLSATMGGTRFTTNVERDAGNNPDDETVPTLSAMTNSIDHDRVGVRLESDPSSGGTRFSWGLGYERIEESLKYLGPYSLTGEGIPGLPYIEFDLTMRNEYEAAWAEARLRPIDPFDVQVGARVERGDSILDWNDVRVSPRVTGRWRLSPETRISAGWGRIFQYSQAIGASGGPLGPQLHIGNLWILSTIGYPALRSDMSTLGVERWFGPEWLLTVNAYRREVSGMAEPDRTPGPIRGVASYVVATSDAYGYEASIRKLLGDWTVTFGYAWGKSITEADSVRYPSDSDIRHSFDAFAAYEFASGLRVGGAASLSSGVPFTRILITDQPSLGAPNAERTPGYASLDLLLDYTATVNGWRVDFFAQLLNALNRANAVTYSGSLCVDEAATVGGQCSAAGFRDDFKSGLPRLPLFGLRVAF